MTQTAPHGIVLLDKPQGMTSHDVVSRLRYHLATKKVGHAGTLDPMATGLLILGVGQGTKLLTYAVGLDKTYDATIRLGSATITDDAEGEYAGPRASSAQLAALTDDAIEAAVGPLRGAIEQVPSAVSAIKVNGQRSYARVRAGEDVELKARPVTIHSFTVHGVRRGTGPDGGFIDVDATVECSSGTYIRALARDLGAALGVGGHLTFLRRTVAGEYRVADAQDVPERDAPRASDAPESAVTLTGLGEFAAQLLPLLPVTVEEGQALRYGQWITDSRGRLAESNARHGNNTNHGADTSNRTDTSNGIDTSNGTNTASGTGVSHPAAAVIPTSGELVALVEPAQGGRLKPMLVFPKI